MLHLKFKLYIFDYILGKVAKLQFSESPQKYLKTRQDSYQESYTLQNNGPLKNEKFVFFGGSFFKTKIEDILKF